MADIEYKQKICHAKIKEITEALLDKNPTEKEQIRIIQAYLEGETVGWGSNTGFTHESNINKNASSLGFTFGAFKYWIVKEKTTVTIKCEGKEVEISRESAKALNLI